MLWSLEAERIEALALGGEGYTAEQYAAAAVKLLDSKHHAVAKNDMMELLGRHEVGDKTSSAMAVAAGKLVFQRLVEVHALSMRPKSAWAQDISPEAFVCGNTVVTAPSAMDLFCIKRLRPMLNKTLYEWEKKRMVCQSVCVTICIVDCAFHLNASFILGASFFPLGEYCHYYPVGLHDHSYLQLARCSSSAG